MIANYQFKYWVFGVPGQQMGRALKLIAGSTGKLRLGFVSSCNEMKERRLLSKEDRKMIITFRAMGIHIITFHETGGRPLGGLPGLSLLLANQSMDGLRT
jgi:hypothetical protein